MTALGNRDVAAETRAETASELRLLIHQIDGAEWRGVAGETVAPLQREVGRLFAELNDRAGELRKSGGANRTLAMLFAGISRASPKNSRQIRTNRNRLEVGVVLLGFGIVAGILFFISRSYRRVRERDLTDRQERRFRSLVESSHDVISTVEPDETLTFVSPNLESVFPSITTPTISFSDLLTADALEVWRDAHANLNRTAKAVTCEITVPGDDGPRTLETVGTPLDAEFGATAWIWRDVTERRELEDQLAHQAFHDPSPASLIVPSWRTESSTCSRELGAVAAPRCCSSWISTASKP